MKVVDQLQRDMQILRDQATRAEKERRDTKLALESYVTSAQLLAATSLMVGIYIFKVKKSALELQVGHCWNVESARRKGVPGKEV